MATQVRHGPDPVFSVPIVGTFSCRIVGHYTMIADARRPSWWSRTWEWLLSGQVAPGVEGLGVGGVTEVIWQSQRPEKRVAELLILRTCFRHWYEQTMRELGQEPSGPYRL